MLTKRQIIFFTIGKFTIIGRFIYQHDYFTKYLQNRLTKFMVRWKILNLIAAIDRHDNVIVVALLLPYILLFLDPNLLFLQNIEVIVIVCITSVDNHIQSQI